MLGHFTIIEGAFVYMTFQADVLLHQFLHQDTWPPAMVGGGVNESRCEARPLSRGASNASVGIAKRTF